MRTLVSLFSVTALLLFASTALSQDEKGRGQGQGGSDKPGPIHKELARMAGDYETVAKFWIKPGTEPMVSNGTAKITSVVNGGCILEESTGTQMGQGFKALRLTGYNNLTKQYESTWTYSLATGLMHMTGTSKDDGKTIEWVASYTNDNGAKQNLYVSTRRIDDDQFVVELVAKTPDGNKGPTLETTYTRKK